MGRKPLDESIKQDAKIDAQVNLDAIIELCNEIDGQAGKSLVMDYADDEPRRAARNLLDGLHKGAFGKTTDLQDVQVCVAMQSLAEQEEKDFANDAVKQAVKSKTSKFRQLAEAARNSIKVLPVLLLLCGSAYANDTAINTIILEAANQPLEGQIAVAEVIRNRMKYRRQTAEEVCLAPKQFSAWNSRAYAVKRLSKATGAEYQRASKAWHESETTNLTNGSDIYFNPKLCKPTWNFALLTFMGQYGSHRFYKEAK